MQENAEFSSNSIDQVHTQSIGGAWSHGLSQLMIFHTKFSLPIGRERTGDVQMSYTSAQFAGGHYEPQKLRPDA